MSQPSLRTPQVPGRLFPADWISRRFIALCFFNVLLTTSYCPSALAEGTSELGPQTGLDMNIVLRLDILDSVSESIAWTGTGSVTVLQPDGALLGTLESGAALAPATDVTGAYFIVLSTDQPPSGSWDISVEVSGVPQTGRLWSPRWQFLQGGYDQFRALNSSLYATVSGGLTELTAVIELSMDGVVGFNLPVLALDGPDTGQLLSEGDSGQDRPAEGLAVYLNPPQFADYSIINPTLTGIELSGGGAGGKEVTLDGPPLEIVFETNVDGQYHFICDLAEDGVFDLTGTGDFAGIGAVSAGSNTIYWDGTDDAGQPVPPGEYTCRLRVVTGALMLEMDDVETAYPGIRIFAVDGALNRTGLCMFWGDGVLDANAVLMPNGMNGLANSGPFGVCSGAYGAPAVANDSARAWGNFTATTKGNNAFLRTLVWLAEDVSGDLAVTVVQPDPIFSNGFE